MSPIEFMSPDLIRAAFIIGMVLSVFFYEKSHLTTGSIVVPGFLGTQLFEPGPGSSTRAGDAILEVQYDQELWAEIWIDEAQLSSIKKETPFELTLTALPDSPMVGIIQTCLPPANQLRLPNATDNPVLQSSSKVCVKINLRAAPAGLVAGLTGSAAIPKNHGRLINDMAPSLELPSTPNLMVKVTQDN